MRNSEIQRQADKLSWAIVPETCPFIDEAFEQLREVYQTIQDSETREILEASLKTVEQVVKKQTSLFRSSFTHSLYETLVAEQRSEDIADQLNREISHLHDEIAYLHEEIEGSRY